LPDSKRNTIGGTIWNLETQIPTEVTKPARGLYLHASYRDSTAEVMASRDAALERIGEAQFYEAFAEWLVKELEECTKAIAVGGAERQAAPDVVHKLDRRPLIARV
jgi:hypothetical protein